MEPARCLHLGSQNVAVTCFQVGSQLRQGVSGQCLDLLFEHCFLLVSRMLTPESVWADEEKEGLWPPQATDRSGN